MPYRATNVINKPLVYRERILFSPLHNKFGLINPFTKALDKDGGCFTYLFQVFPGLPLEEMKAAIFDCPQISQVIRDAKFENSMYDVELETWKAFVLVVKNFLVNNKARNCADIVINMLIPFRYLDAT